jgi:hypothetical protein
MARTPSSKTLTRHTAKSQPTRQKRLKQMLDELERGGVYMKMKWKG